MITIAILGGGFMAAACSARVERSPITRERTAPGAASNWAAAGPLTWTA